MLKSSIPISFGLSTLLARQQPAVAAGSPPSAEDLNRIKQGYEQIQYLLANFEQETTVCRENGGECKRDAEPVRKGTSTKLHILILSRCTLAYPRGCTFR